MNNHQKLSRDIAGFLLQINAIKLNVEYPFTWASGLRSPIYCDNRRTLSYPKIRNSIASGLANLVSEHHPETELIAGVATGAIAHGVLTASNLNLPFVYVRSNAKGHGLGNQVEGCFEKNQKVVVIEDLVSTGKSSMAAIEALKEAGLNVLGMVSIFSYNLDVAVEKFRDGNCRFDSLSDYETLISMALDQGLISLEQLKELQTWRDDPAAWSASH